MMGKEGYTGIVKSLAPWSGFLMHGRGSVTCIVKMHRAAKLNACEQECGFMYPEPKVN